MSALSIAEVLEKAADRVEAPGAWTQGQMARDAQGRPTPWNSGAATCFCALGAIAVINGKSVWREGDAQWFFEDFIGPQDKVVDLADGAIWNDAPGRTQAEVVAKLREAAALARREGR